MPHVRSDSGGAYECSSDEVKVYKDEGEEKTSSENLNELTEEHDDLIDLSESEVCIGASPAFCPKKRRQVYACLPTTLQLSWHFVHSGGTCG